MRITAAIALIALTTSSIGLGVSTTATDQNNASLEKTDNPFASVLVDLDADGVQELVKTLPAKTKGQDRISIQSLKTKKRSSLIEMDSTDHWGPGAYATSVAAGNIDEDSNTELAVSRRNSVNMRVALYDFVSRKGRGSRTVGRMQLIQEFGKDWGRKYFAQQAAFGDLDGDGRDELIITTNAPDRLYNADPNPKRPGPVMIYTRYDNSQAFQPVYHMDGYFKGFKVGYIAIRDMNRDGKMDILVTEKTESDSKMPRYKVFTPAQIPNRAITSRMTLLSKGKKKFANNFFIQKDETRIASAD